ncbi:MAG TPA: DUF5709 domain-containing protein [Mycobacteriales bacterium]|nr:DUF5709 domain-containing protein [Mycobacteriales bacterium]
MSSRIPDPADPFEEEGLASPDPDNDGKRITGDTQEEIQPPLDRPVAVDDFGTTAAEEAAGESLDGRLDREQPDMFAAAARDADESPDADQPYPSDPEERVGRIVETDEGARSDDEPDAVAVDVGTDLGGFSAEERAMHVEADPET